MKKRIFVLLMCATMMISSFAVMAVNVEEPIGYGNQRAIARLHTQVIWGVPTATATTTPLTEYYLLQTRVRWVGAYGVSGWTDGKTEAGRTAVGVSDPSYAESFHAINAISKYLTASY